MYIFEMVNEPTNLIFENDLLLFCKLCMQLFKINTALKTDRLKSHSTHMLEVIIFGNTIYLVTQLFQG